MQLRRDPAKVLIRTDRLTLRLPRRGDEAPIADFYLRNRDYLQPLSPTFDPELFTVRGWRGRVEATLGEYRAGKGLRLIVMNRAALHRVIGVANFTYITGFPTYQCNLGYSVDQAEQGKGVMTEALAGAIEYVFTELNLHRVEANYMPRNLASARVLEKLGFVIEGHAKDYILIDGRWEDHVRTSLTNPDWVNP